MKFVAACFVMLFVAVQSYRGDQTRDVNTFHTTGSTGAIDFRNVWALMRERHYIVLGIKSCGDAHIRLAYSIMHSDNYVAEVRLGASSNMLILINHTSDGSVYHDHSGILHCGEFRVFWISWGENGMSVGKGPVAGVQVVTRLDWNSSMPHTVNEVGFASGTGFTAAWQMEENLGYNLFVKTYGDRRYHYLKKGSRSKNGFITFKVLSCGDIHIGLQSRSGHVDYEISIGTKNNTQACISDGDSPGCENHTGLAYCVFFRMFWIGWRNGVISFGKGRFFDREVVMSRAVATTDDVDYISPTTGNGGFGLWALEDDLEGRYEFFTAANPKDATPRYGAWVVLTRGRTYTYFRIHGCADSWIALASNKDAEPSSTLHIRLGANENRQISVYNFSISTTTPIVTKNVSGAINCGISIPFFISWSGGTVRMGSSAVYDVTTLFSFDVPDLGFIKAVGFGSTHEKGAYWTVLRSSGSEIYVNVDGQSSNRTTWITTESVTFQVFRVRACKNVALLLAEVVGDVHYHAYEIAIATGGEETTCIRDVSSGDSIKKETLTEFLSCTEMRAFWVGWRDGHIRVGKGYRYGREELIAMPIPRSIHFNAISLSNENVSGQWQFDSDQGSYFIARGSAADVSHARVLLTNDTQFLVFQLSGEYAKVVISSSELTDSDDSYAVVFHGYARRVTLERNGQVLQSGDHDGAITAARLHDVWVSWYDAEIVVGISKSIGEQVLLRHQGDAQYTAKSVAVSAHNKSHVEWKCSTQLVNDVVYVTGPSYDIDQLWFDMEPRTSVVVTLTACGSASVLLSGAIHDTDSEDSYLITLDDNATSSIRSVDKKTVHVTQITSQLLFCTEKRVLWISWHNGQVAVGRGDVMGHDIIMAYEEMNPFRLTALSVTTDGSRGTWQFAINEKLAEEEEEEESDSNALSTAEIIGAVVGCVAVVVLAIVIGLCVKRHRESFDVGDHQDLQDASSVASSHGYTNSNFTSNM